VRAFILALAALAWPLAAQGSLVDRAYDHFYNLELDAAIQVFQQALAASPQSPDLHNHVAEALVFREMYRDGALESEMVSGNNSFLRRPKLNPTPQNEKWFLDEVNRAIALAEERLKANPKDAAALYAEGISYGLLSDYYWVVKKSWYDSLKDANTARRLDNRVSDLQPDNVDARLVQGLHDYIVGSLPWAYRMLGFMVGVHGDKAKGIQTIQYVAKNGKDNLVDAQIFLCALYRRENTPRLAIPMIQDLIQRYPRNFLLRLELSHMYSAAGEKANALSAVHEVAALKTSHAPGYDRVPWEQIYFQEGTIQFWYGDFDASLENMKKVTAADDLDLNSGAYAYLRMGQIYDITNRRALALGEYRKAIAYAPEALAAQEARKYLSEPYRKP